MEDGPGRDRSLETKEQVPALQVISIHREPQKTEDKGTGKMQKAEYQAICRQIEELGSQDRKLRDQQSASYREQSELQAQY